MAYVVCPACRSEHELCDLQIINIDHCWSGLEYVSFFCPTVANHLIHAPVWRTPRTPQNASR